MKMMHAVLICALAGCGTGKRDESAKPAPETTDATQLQSDAAAALPQFLIAKVPVDAAGNLLDDQASTRELMSNADLTDGSAASAAFDQGATVSVVDELDRDSSQQQWHNSRWSWYWGTPWYPGKLVGRGLWWGRNPYTHYHGHHYTYRPYQHYYWNNCYYYVYNRGWY